MPVLCQKCGIENVDATKFCVKCGTKMVTAEPQPDPATTEGDEGHRDSALRFIRRQIEMGVPKQSIWERLLDAGWDSESLEKLWALASPRNRNDMATGQPVAAVASPDVRPMADPPPGWKTVAKRITAGSKVAATALAAAAKEAAERGTEAARARGVFCTQCGHRNPRSSDFCGKCGRSLHEAKAAVAGNSQRAAPPPPAEGVDADAGPTAFCPKCGLRNPVAHDFCAKCGVSLSVVRDAVRRERTQE